MTRLLIAATAAFALAGAAAAQPAYDSSQGAAPGDYPRCTQPGQDRCVAGGRHMAGKPMMKGKMHHARKAGPTKSSKDGERG